MVDITNGILVVSHLELYNELIIFRGWGLARHRDRSIAPHPAGTMDMEQQLLHFTPQEHLMASPGFLAVGGGGYAAHFSAGGFVEPLGAAGSLVVASTTAGRGRWRTSCSSATSCSAAMSFPSSARAIISRGSS